MCFPQQNVPAATPPPPPAATTDPSVQARVDAERKRQQQLQYQTVLAGAKGTAGQASPGTMKTALGA